jgi:hypothetical protein
MRVRVEKMETSQALEYDEVKNTYTKGPFYCVYLANGQVEKHPVSEIFRVIEDFGSHGNTGN